MAVLKIIPAQKVLTIDKVKPCSPSLVLLDCSQGLRQISNESSNEVNIDLCRFLRYFCLQWFHIPATFSELLECLACVLFQTVIDQFTRHAFVAVGWITTVNIEGMPAWHIRFDAIVPELFVDCLVKIDSRAVHDYFSRSRALHEWNDNISDNIKHGCLDHSLVISWQCHRLFAITLEHPLYLSCSPVSVILWHNESLVWLCEGRHGCLWRFVCGHMLLNEGRSMEHHQSFTLYIFETFRPAELFWRSSFGTIYSWSQSTILTLCWGIHKPHSVKISDQNIIALLS